jgi:hypothetical protein
MQWRVDDLLLGGGAGAVPIPIHQRQHVLLAHATVAAGPGHRLEVYSVLGGDPLHDRRVAAGGAVAGRRGRRDPRDRG